MSKYCKSYALRVTYLDCMECETKECKKKEGNRVSEMVYLALKPDEEVYLVFASKREGYKDNVVIRCSVRECSIRKNTTMYYLTKEKVVLGKKDIKPFIDCFSCENANIDTGYRGMQMDKYPVFTTKDRCVEWLKG